MEPDRRTRLLGLFMLALALFNFPILFIFGKGNTINGIPVLYIYILVVWVLLLFFLIFALRTRKF